MLALPASSSSAIAATAEYSMNSPGGQCRLGERVSENIVEKEVGRIDINSTMGSITVP